MITEQRIESVERFGYSPREAGFLVLAALHSGYFLTRQYCAYLGVGFGYPDDMLTSKLLRLRHAREVSLRYGRRLYRIHSKPIYAALGEVDNRNRRVHNPETIQARLMGLDYALSRPEATWYPTETDRVSLFADQFGIGKEHLPTRCYASRNGSHPTFRYFVEKPPIFTLPADTTVHFCYADPGYHTRDGFISFLEDYRPLLSRVERSHLIYLAADTVSFDRARSIFKRWISPSRTAPIDPVLPDLVEYFEHRREHEAAGLAGFDVQRLSRYRDARRRFGGAVYDHLFGLWQANGVETIRRGISPESSPDLNRRCAFSALIPTRITTCSDASPTWFRSVSAIRTRRRCPYDAAYDFPSPRCGPIGSRFQEVAGNRQPFCGGARGRRKCRSDPGICGGFPPQMPFPRSYRRCGGRTGSHLRNHL